MIEQGNNVKTIKIQIGNKQLDFNTIREASEYLGAIEDLQTNKSNKDLTLEAINRVKRTSSTEIKANSMTIYQLKEYLFDHNA